MTGPDNIPQQLFRKRTQAHPSLVLTGAVCEFQRPRAGAGPLEAVVVDAPAEALERVTLDRLELTLGGAVGEPHPARGLAGQRLTAPERVLQLLLTRCGTGRDTNESERQIHESSSIGSTDSSIKLESMEPAMGYNKD